PGLVADENDVSSRLSPLCSFACLQRDRVLDSERSKCERCPCLTSRRSMRSSRRLCSPPPSNSLNSQPCHRRQPLPGTSTLTRSRKSSSVPS
ncbi:hypothetical protein BMF94_6934, partial [Rhodotorula taiwanensis]